MSEDKKYYKHKNYHLPGVGEASHGENALYQIRDILTIIAHKINPDAIKVCSQNEYEKADCKHLGFNVQADYTDLNSNPQNHIDLNMEKCGSLKDNNHSKASILDENTLADYLMCAANSWADDYLYPAKRVEFSDDCINIYNYAKICLKKIKSSDFIDAAIIYSMRQRCYAKKSCNEDEYQLQLRWLYRGCNYYRTLQSGSNEFIPISAMFSHLIDVLDSHISDYENRWFSIS